MIIRELAQRIHFSFSADRIGPDLPFTHWMLHFPTTMRRLCRRKFQRFGRSAEFRPGSYAVCCSKISIGERVVIRPGTMLFADPSPGGAGILIENDVLIGSAVHMYAVNHRFDDATVPIIFQGHQPSRPVILRRGCWIGAHVTILPGVEIGENSVIGAGSVVTRDIGPHVVASGVPARAMKRIGADS